MKIQRPLWQLARQSLSQSQNQQQFHEFLRTNQDNQQSQRINEQILFLRISILLTLYQFKFASQSKYWAAYLAIKILVLFRFQKKSSKFIDIAIVSVCFPFLSFLVSNLPFANAIFWAVPLFYFLFGFQERYLCLQLMANGHNTISNLVFIIIILTGNIRKDFIYSHYIIITDIIAFLLLNENGYTLASAFAFCFVKIICYTDRRMIETKKLYKHLYAVPKFEEYH